MSFSRNSNRGFSLLEVVIAAGILAGLALTIAKLTDNAQKMMNTTEMKINALAAINKIYADLSSANVCSTTLQKFGIESIINEAAEGTPLTISKIQTTEKVNHVTYCAGEDDSAIKYLSPSMTARGNCYYIFSKPFAHLEKYYFQCQHETPVKSKDVCWREATANVGNGTAFATSYYKELYAPNALIDGVKLINIELIGVVNSTDPNVREIKVRVIVDIRGNNTNKPIYGSPLLKKEFSVRAHIEEPTAGVPVITSCHGDFSEESAVEKSCQSLGGTYAGGVCTVPNQIKSCTNRFILMSRDGTGRRIYYTPTGSYIDEPTLVGIESKSQSISTWSVTYNQPRYISHATSDDDEIVMFSISAKVCNDGEIALFGSGACLTDKVFNKKASSLLEHYAAQISRIGKIDDPTAKQFWTIGCQMNKHDYNVFPATSASANVICCEADID